MNVNELLDTIEDALEESAGMPLSGGKRIVDVEQIRDYLDEIRQDYVVLMEGDLVANLPLTDIFEHHLRTHADITAVCGDDSFATENGTYFEKEPDGRIREVLINMHRPRGYRSLDVFIMSTELLRSLVDECQARLSVRL